MNILGDIFKKIKKERCINSFLIGNQQVIVIYIDFYEKLIYNKLLCKLLMLDIDIIFIKDDNTFENELLLDLFDQYLIVVLEKN